MAKYRKIVTNPTVENLGVVNLASWKLECGHYTFLKDQHDKPKVGDRRLCRLCE